MAGMLLLMAAELLDLLVTYLAKRMADAVMPQTLRAQLGEALAALELTLVRQSELAALRTLAAAVEAGGDTQAALCAWQQVREAAQGPMAASPAS